MTQQKTQSKKIVVKGRNKQRPTARPCGAY